MKPEGYQPLSGRAKWARRALITLIVLDAISVASGYFEYSLYGQDVITQDELDSNDFRQAVVGILDLTAFALAIVLFIRWFKRAYANLQPLGVPELRYRRGWAIWGWFFPFLNLYRPKQLANDIWRGSDPAAPAQQGEDWDWGRLPALLQWWWGVYLCWGFLYGVAARIYSNENESQQAAAAAGMVADSVSVIGGILAVLVVRSATMRQEERAARLAAAPAVPTEP